MGIQLELRLDSIKYFNIVIDTSLDIIISHKSTSWDLSFSLLSLLCCAFSPLLNSAPKPFRLHAWMMLELRTLSVRKLLKLEDLMLLPISPAWNISTRWNPNAGLAFAWSPTWTTSISRDADPKWSCSFSKSISFPQISIIINKYQSTKLFNFLKSTHLHYVWHQLLGQIKFNKKNVY